MDLIKIENEDNKRYEELIIKRDELLVEANSHYIKYKKEFGDEEIKIFKEEIECIKYKKIISYLQNLINHEEILDLELLNAEITKQMLVYKTELEKRMKELLDCKKSHIVSEYDKNEVKKIYKKLVKALHPDIYPKTEEDEELFKIWLEISDAYTSCNLKRMKELEIIANKYIKENNINIDLNFIIDDIEEKIKEIEEEIADIIRTEPYTYIEILIDDKKIKERHEENSKELQKYIDYKNELNVLIEELKKRVIK